MREKNFAPPKRRELMARVAWGVNIFIFTFVVVWVALAVNSLR